MQLSGLAQDKKQAEAMQETAKKLKMDPSDDSKPEVPRENAPGSFEKLMGGVTAGGRLGGDRN